MAVLPPDIDKHADDFIQDFKQDFGQFLEPIGVFSEMPEVKYEANLKEFDFVSDQFAKERNASRSMEDLKRLFGHYVGHVLADTFWQLSAGWTLDPLPDSATYLKPVIGPFAVKKQGHQASRSAMPNNVIYAIGDEPFCLWEDDIDEAATSFLQTIDHSYFEYLVRRVSPDLDDPENGLRAATSLRLGLFHASETLFLLIGALLQGEKCPHAWIGSCSTSELRTVLERIGAEGDLLLLNHRIKKLTWLDIARETLRPVYQHPDVERAAASFAKLWELLALNHTQQISIDEFNSLKHGFRVAHGGFSVEFGQPLGEEAPGTETMTSLGTSQWGGMFRVIRKFEKDLKGSRSRQSILTAVNWDAIAASAALRLVAASIKNVVSCLQTYRRGAQANFEAPSQAEFEAAFKRISLLSMTLPRSSHAQTTTKQELLDQIRKNTGMRLAQALRRFSAAKV